MSWKTRLSQATEDEEETLPHCEPQGRQSQASSQELIHALLFILDTLPPAPPPATEAPKLEPRLGELMVTDVTPDSVGLLWTVPEGEFDSFMVQYKDRDGQPQVVPVAADQREVTIPGLEPSRKYKFLLFGLRDGRRRGQVSVETKTGEAQPEPHLRPQPSLECL